MKGLLCCPNHSNCSISTREYPGHGLIVYTNTCRHIATVRILEHFFFLGGGPESILFYLFWNNKASSKYINTLNGVHI